MAEIRFHELDIADTRSIKDFAEYLKRSHEEGIDFAINNAGIAMQGFDSNDVKTTLRCNYYGTLEATEHFLPLKNKGRVVNITSISEKLNKYSETIRDQFLAFKTVPDITKLMERLQSAVDAAKEKKQGWPSAGYAVSKAGVVGMTKAIGTVEKEKGSKVLINSYCPRYVKTDMTRVVDQKHQIKERRHRLFLRWKISTIVVVCSGRTKSQSNGKFPHVRRDTHGEFNLE